MARRIVLTGGKGGAGKTTICACLAIALAKKGKHVLVVDADFGLNNVDVVFGLEGRAAHDLVDVVEGKCRAKQALVRHPDFPTLALLSSNRSSAERYLSPQSLKAVVDGLEGGFDFVLIDSPDGVEEGFHRAVVCASEAIVVTTPHLTALRDADKAIELLKSYRLQNTWLLVNKVRGDRLIRGECLTPLEIADLLSLPLIGVIPDDDRLDRATFCDGGKPFSYLVSNLILGKKRLFDATKKYAGFWGGIKRMVRKNL